jgi:tRNA (adenine57-N1/adenine58-N1)-methyltransferase
MLATFLRVLIAFYVSGTFFRVLVSQQLPDAGTILPIVALADIRPGMHVFEAGVGSGGLTLALLDAVGPTGSVISCEIREDHAEIARRNVARFHGAPPTNWQLHVGDAQDVLATTQVQRIVLDLLEPWRLLRASARSLPPGGLLLTYVPSVPQIMRITETLWELGTFTDVSTVETLVRGWALEGLAVRPAHRMVAHTAFLTRARRVPTRAEGGPQPPRARRVQTAGLRWVDDLDGAIPEEDQGAAHPDEERLDEAQRYVVERVQERPLQSTAIALGVGLVLGMLLAGRRR